MIAVPVPRDSPLPLPVSSGLLQALLVVSFIAHILFVNFMVGGATMVLGFQLWGRRRPDYDQLARLLATTVTVNKSLAVVLGVAPLLLINVLYTVHFYTANALTCTAWILLVPLIAATFLLLYLHKYTWDTLDSRRTLHIATLAIAVALLWFIPLVFLANANLMLFPERWASVRGFWSTLWLPNVLPRYLHFMAASLVATSLFGVWYVGRKRTVLPAFERLTVPELRRVFYRIAFAVSLVQFAIGPLVLITLPRRALTAPVVMAITTGVVVAVPAVYMMWQELRMAAPQGKRLAFIVWHLTLTVGTMALGRHMYRGMALVEHQAVVAKATAQWEAASSQAAYNLATAASRDAAV